LTDRNDPPLRKEGAQLKRLLLSIGADEKHDAQSTTTEDPGTTGYG
jgi:hypothetical protein